MHQRVRKVIPGYRDVATNFIYLASGQQIPHYYAKTRLSQYLVPRCDKLGRDPPTKSADAAIQRAR